MKSPLLTGFLSAFVLAATAALPSCSGGGGDGGGGSLTGTITVSLTDAASDQVESFRVTVASIDLQKSNGTTFSALNGPVEVDLADMTDTGQVLNSLTATIGTYTRATVTLDLSTAVCLLAGQSAPATIHDDQGAAFGAAVVVPVNFPSFFSLTGSSHRLAELDLDLGQSLQIDSGTNTVQFAPAFVVRTTLAQQKPVFLAGTIASVDLLGSSFVVTLTDENSVLIGSVTCTSDNATVFQTDGVAATGAAGLTALSLMAAGTSVQAQATIDPAAASVLVTNVNAGLGTWNGGTAIIEGHVIDRDLGAGADATLTVLGRSSNAAHDTFQYNTAFTVTTTFLGTKVVRHASGTAYDTDEINIGQHVRIFGTLTGVTMAADTGVLREQPTWIYGMAMVDAPLGGPITLALASVGLRNQNLFNWTVNPNALVTDVGTLADTLGIIAGTHVLERGFFTGVGGGSPDFTADAVVNADTAPALLLVRNLLPTGTGFDVTLTCGVSQIDVTITGTPVAGELAVVGQAFVGTSDLPASPVPNIVPAGALGLYTIRDVTAGGFTVYLNFASFSSALGSLVGAGSEVRHVAAVGSWDALTSTLSASLASVLVQ